MKSESCSVVSLWPHGLYVEFSRPEYWGGQPFPFPGDLPNPGIEPRSPALQADSWPAEPPGKLCISYGLMKILGLWGTVRDHTHWPPWGSHVSGKLFSWDNNKKLWWYSRPLWGVGQSSPFCITYSLPFCPKHTRLNIHTPELRNNLCFFSFNN